MRYNKIIILFFILVIAFCHRIFAQDIFKGLLINKVDSSAIAFAGIHVQETDKDIMTDEKGAFTFPVSPDVKKITFTISVIGNKTTLVYKRTFHDVEKIYLDVAPEALTEVTIEGVPPEDIVRKAVAAIQDNYMDTSYFSYSHYRQYQHVNNGFANLIEVQPVVMFRLSDTKHGINAEEGFAVTELRRTHFSPNPGNIYETNIANLMAYNPIYHLSASSLDPHKFDSYKFSFDTARSDDYVINYYCTDFSSEGHGIDDYSYDEFRGESWEMGKFIIEKGTFAIKEIQRTSYRYPGYHYPKYNNLLQPDRKYFVEFIAGKLIADYFLFNGKWYLKKLLHQYTNDFQNVFNAQKFTITENFEWYSDTVSKYTSPALFNSFYSRMKNGRYIYNRSKWDDVNFPFYFYKKEAVYKDLERKGPMDIQFENEGQSTNTSPY